jgi:hypothetical protein
MEMHEVETVSVLVTDLVESTCLESRIGTVAAGEPRHGHFAAASALRRVEGITGWEAGNLADGARAYLRAGDPARGRAVEVRR